MNEYLKQYLTFLLVQLVKIGDAVMARLGNNGLWCIAADK